MSKTEVNNTDETILKTGGGLFGALFKEKDNYDDGYKNKKLKNTGSSYDSETGYHLTAEQKKMRRLERHGEVSYTKAVESEQNLITSYENLAKSSRNYYQSYNRHLGNLITLDENLGIHGLEETFKSQVIKNVFKGYDTVDRSNPLLLRNYLVSNATMPRNFRKEHLLSQIRYIMRKFNPKDELLIQSTDISLDGTKAVIKLRGLNSELYERTIQVDKDFNLDMTELKKNIKDVILAIKRKMDFEIEIVSDFELGGDDIEIPGLMFIDDDNALDKRLKNLEFAKSLNATGPIPVSQMSAKDKPNAPPPPKKNIIFDISVPRPKAQPIVVPLAPEGAKIPGTQGFGEVRQLEKKPFVIEDEINKILGGPTAAADAPPAANGFPGAAPGGFPGAPGGFAPGGFAPGGFAPGPPGGFPRPPPPGGFAPGPPPPGGFVPRPPGGFAPGPPGGFPGGPGGFVPRPPGGFVPGAPGGFPRPPGGFPGAPGGFAPRPPGGFAPPPGGFQPPNNPAAQEDTRDEQEKKCNALTSQPEVCKTTPGCFYNTKRIPPKCHKGMKIG